MSSSSRRMPVAAHTLVARIKLQCTLKVGMRCQRLLKSRSHRMSCETEGNSKAHIEEQQRARSVHVKVRCERVAVDGQAEQRLSAPVIAAVERQTT